MALYTPPGADNCDCDCGGYLCCPHGEVEFGSVCVTFPTGFPDDGVEALIGGQAFTLPPITPGNRCHYQLTTAHGTYVLDSGFGPCTYQVTLTVDAVFGPVAVGVGNVRVDWVLTFIHLSGPCAPVTFRYAQGIVENTAGGVPAVAGCLPQTLPDGPGTIIMGGGPNNGLFLDHPAGTTVTAGPCGGMLMAAHPPAGRPKSPARPRVCVYAERTEHLAGCGGFNCRHLCTIGIRRPGSADAAAVRAHLGDSDVVLPSDECQDCPGYVAR